MKLFPTFSQYSFEDIAEQFTLITKRFPLSVISAIVMTVLVIFLAHLDYENSYLYSAIWKVFSTASIGFVLGVVVTLLLESSVIKKARSAYLGVTLFLVAYYASLTQNITDQVPEFIVGQILVYLGFVALLFVGPYLRGLLYSKSETSDELFVFGLTTFKSIARAAIYSIIIFLLGVILLATLSALFELSFVNEKRYIEWAALSFMFFGQILLLTGIPTVFNDKDVPQKTTLLFTKRIALPFIAIYTVILYTYFISILFTGVWPKGMVPWLAIWFSFFAFFAYVAAYPYQSRFNVFKPKYIPFILALPLALLFYGIIVRISAYGFTINRYLVLAYGLWVAGIALYYIFSKKKALGVLPLSLAVVSLLISVGPWGVFSVSKSSQIDHLENLLTKHNVVEASRALEEGKTLTIDSKDADSIRSTVDYICGFHGCHIMKDLLGPIYINALNKTGEYDHYMLQSNIIDEMKLPNYGYISDGKEYLSVSYPYMDMGGVIDVAGFKTMQYIDMKSDYLVGPDQSQKEYLVIKDGNVTAHLQGQEPINLTLFLQAELLVNKNKSIEKMGESFQEIYGTKRIKIYPTYISGYQTGETTVIESARVLVLIGDK